MRLLALLLALTLAATGCTSSILMRHSDGRTATCGDSYAYGIHSASAAQRDRQCIEDYQRQGFERAPR
jgi:hypothetical protein